MPNISLAVKNTKQVIFEMRSIGQKVVEGARKVMHSAADKVEKEAKLNAPVDTYRLEESIHQEVDYTGAGGRLQISVVAGGEVDGVNVDEYAAIIELNYESYQPGEGTRQKQDANPDRYVGGRYMERAGDTVEQRLPAKMIQGITRIIKTGSTNGLDDDGLFDSDAQGEIEG